jgi:hypothetical protein
MSDKIVFTTYTITEKVEEFSVEEFAELVNKSIGDEIKDKTDMQKNAIVKRVIKYFQKRGFTNLVEDKSRFCGFGGAEIYQDDDLHDFDSSKEQHIFTEVFDRGNDELIEGQTCDCGQLRDNPDDFCKHGIADGICCVCKWCKYEAKLSKK